VVPKHDLEVAEAALKADEEKVRALRAQESYLVVSAPFDGIITERNIHPGALVGPPSGPMATPLLRLEQVGRLRLTVAVPESEAGAVTEGVTARFSVRAWPGQKFEGVARRISHSLDPKTRTMAVELDVENPDERLAPGMFAEVAWPVRRSAPSLLVPPSAVMQTPEKTYVDRVKDGAVEQVPVGRGVLVADKVEVFGPLQPGDTVLKRGSEELKTGDKVSPKPAQEQPKPK
jgi:RND family efflux transporter MFP subunit